MKAKVSVKVYDRYFLAKEYKYIIYESDIDNVIFSAQLSAKDDFMKSFIIPKLSKRYNVSKEILTEMYGNKVINLFDNYRFEIIINQ